MPEGKYADIGDGLRIHYHESGAGTPVRVPPRQRARAPAATRNFRHNYPYFAERGFRAIVADTLGFGHSSQAGRRRLRAGLRRRRACGASSIALGIERCAVVGNSHGGAMAIQLALDDPSGCRKLVLMAPGGLEEREAYMKMAGIRTMMKVFLGPEGHHARGHAPGVRAAAVRSDAARPRRSSTSAWQVAKDQPKRVLPRSNVPHLAPRLGRADLPGASAGGA